MTIDHAGVVHFDAGEEAEFQRGLEAPALEPLRSMGEIIDELIRILCR